jgi:hypothetical protein
MEQYEILKKPLLKVVAERLTLLLRVPETLGSTLGLDSGYPG